MQAESWYTPDSQSRPLNQIAGKEKRMTARPAGQAQPQSSHFPDAPLPRELQDADPLGIRRMVDGELTQQAL